MSEPARQMTLGREYEPPAERDPLMRLIERAMTDPSFDVAKMERIVAMHERGLAQQAARAFDDAMVEVQKELTPVRDDADNPQTRSKYATYLALDRIVRPVYTKHGFSIIFGQGEGAPEQYVRIEAHVSRAGHTRTYHIDMPADGKGAKGGDVMTKTHATGSASTYGRRYLLTMIFNLVIGEMQDDDGNAAGRDHAPISAEQKEQILALIKATNSDTKRLLKYVFPRSTPASVDEIPAWKFPDVIAALERKKKP